MYKKVTRELIKKRAFQVFLIGVILSTLGGIILPIGSDISKQATDNKQAATLAYMGEISPFKIDTTNSSQMFWLHLGGNEAGDTIGRIKQGLDIVNSEINFGEKLPISINIVNDTVLISANVTNADLQLVAWFENNTWKCPPDSLGIGDRNYNSQAFEVVDRNNVSIFSIQIVALNTIQIGGLFKYSDGSVIAISDNGLGAESEPNQATIEKFLVPIFKYPSNKYLGELVNPPNPQNNASNVPLNNWDQLFFEASVINTIGYFVLGSGVFFVILAEIVREKEQHDKDKLKDMLKEKASLNNRPKKRK